MDIKRVISTFNISNNQGFHFDNLSVPNEVKFPSRSLKQQICFKNLNNDICIDLINYKREELREFKLMESSLISKDYLNILSAKFLFKITNHPLASELSIAIIPEITNEYGKTCYGAVRKNDNKYFFMIYSKKGSTNFEDDTIYIFGLWEVSLPKKIELELFNL